MSAWAVGAAAALGGAAVAGALAPLQRSAPAGRRPPVRRRRSPTPDDSPRTGRGPSRHDPQAGGRLKAPASLGAGFGALMLVGGWLGLAAGLVCAAAVWRILARMEPTAVRRRRERLERALPHAVDLIAASLAVGSSPTTAVQLVAEAVDEPMRDELSAVTCRLALGVDPVRVWSEVGRHPTLGPLGRRLVRAIDTGSSVSEAMHRLAEDLRRDARADAEARARAVGVKAAAPLGLCLLPAFILVGVVPLVAGSVAMLLGR